MAVLPQALLLQTNTDEMRFAVKAYEVGVSLAAAGVISRAYRTGPEQSWTLVPAEADTPRWLALRGDGAPDSFLPVHSVNVIQSSGVMGFDPGTTPTSAAPLSFDLTHTFASAHNEDNLSGIISALKLMTSRQKKTRRPPMMRLSYGPWKETVWVAGHSMTVGEFWPGKDYPTWIRVQLSLVRARAITTAKANVGRPRETTWHKLSGGESFELVALKYWGDPARSTTLRRINPEVLEESPGVTLKVLDSDHPLVERDPFTSLRAPCFVEGFADRMQEIAEERIGWTSGSWQSLGDDSTIGDDAVTIYEAP